MQRTYKNGSELNPQYLCGKIPGNASRSNQLALLSYPGTGLLFGHILERGYFFTPTILLFLQNLRNILKNLTTLDLRQISQSSNSVPGSAALAADQ